MSKSKLLNYIILFLSGLLASFSLPPLNIFPLIFFLSIPFFCLIKCINSKEAFVIGFLTAFGWFVFSFYWLSNALLIGGGVFLWMIPLVIFGFPAFLSCFWGLAFLLINTFGKSISEKLILITLLFPFFEWLRGNVFSGFPWNMIGFSLNNPIEISQTISFLGPFGQNILIVVLILIPVSLKLNKKIFTSIGLVFCFLVFSFSFYYYKTNSLILSDSQVRIVQPNFSHHEKWDKKKFNENLQRLTELSGKNENNNFIIWPETAIVNFHENINEDLQNIIKTIFDGKKGYLLTGMPRKEYIENIKHYYNSMYVFNNLGDVVAIYDKKKLVPFGEFNPFKSFLNNFGLIASNQEFSKGKDRNSFFKLDKLKIFPMICYEAIFPSKIGKINTSDVIINITNDHWFGDTFGPHQHHVLAKQRAIETGIPIIRVSNSGISSVIAPNGSELKQINYNEKGFIEFQVPEKFKPTLYLIYGESIYYYMSIILLALFLYNKIQIIKLSLLKKNE